jgi:hypothetical protein
MDPSAACISKVEEARRFVAVSVALVASSVVQNASRAGEPLPSIRVALGAEPRRGDRTLGFKAAAAALELEYSDAGSCRLERVVGGEVAFRRETIHADRHFSKAPSGKGLLP